MLLILSPAKRLNEDNPVKCNPENTPVFLEEARKVNAALKKLSPKKLMDLQSVSSAIANQNWERNQSWQAKHEDAVFYPALFLFNGDAYQGLQPETLSAKNIAFAQEHLRILSGLYGWLKPLDHIETYRLEMGTPLKVGRKPSLYAFWQQGVTKQLVTEFGKTPIINLASNEYSQVLDFKRLKNPVYHVAFKDRNTVGQYKVMSYYAKRARGFMARYIIERELQHPEELIHFDVEGYRYAANESGPTNLVFLRDH